MAEKNQQYNVNITQASKGLHSDTSPINQPKGSYRFALNAVNETKEGDQGYLSNEPASYACCEVTEGFIPIGNEYIGDDTTVIILVNPETGVEEISLVDKSSKYTTIVSTSVLGLKVTNQCDITYRLRRGNEKVIYWVDGNSTIRTFNISKPQNFYSSNFQTYLKAGGNPDTYIGEKWDASSFDLVKTYSKIPTFDNIEVLESGTILPGSYNFAIQLVDQDFNPTAWITTSNTANIFNDTITGPYERIRGSRNVQTDSQNFPRANKSIKLTLGNLDTEFPYYRIAIIMANGNNGKVNKVLASDLYSTSESSYIYTGNDSNLAETKLEDIIIDKETIFAPQHIEQLENRLVVANTKGKNVNWCDFQKYASKIGVDLVTKEVILNSVLSEPNVKNVKSTFIYRGYMPGEVYSMGIVYIFKDGYISPVFHIPGKSNTNTFSKMKVYEITNNYLDVHSCSTSNYWGLDIEGKSLVGKKIRHHRFPFRKEVNKPLVTRSQNSVNIDRHSLTISISLNPDWVSPDIDPSTGEPFINFYPLNTDGSPIIINYGIEYIPTGAGTSTIYNSVLTIDDLGALKIVYDDINSLDLIDSPNYGQLDITSDLAIYQEADNERFIITYTYTTNNLTSLYDTDISEIFGMKFFNIEIPHPDVTGFYIVRNDRDYDDRMIIDNTVIGLMTSYQQYKSFGILTPKPNYPLHPPRVGVPPLLCYNPFSPTISTIYIPNLWTYFRKSLWFFNPEYQFFNKKIEFTKLEVEGIYTQSTVDIAPCSGIGGTRGVYINDVQAGTSYNPEVNRKKDKDDDGFDLVIGWRNTNMVYGINSSLVIPNKDKTYFLNAATPQNVSPDTYYNVSVDNKVGIVTFPTEFDISLLNVLYNSTTTQNNLIYASMVRDSNTLYSNYVTRPYYKEHNNPILFGSNTVVNNFDIYNGDSQISATNIVSSTFNDMVVANREKKNQVWKIIVGAVLIVVGVVVAIYTGGAGAAISAAGAALIAGLAISYGVSLAMSGIKFEQFKKMIDVDYEKGLKETVTDGGVNETVVVGTHEDDTITWFADRINNIYIESSVPFGLRSGLTCGVTDFTDSPTKFDNSTFGIYLTEKLTVIDRDQGSGRLYKGYATAEVYDMNLDYLRHNKEKIFFHLPNEYDCCSIENEVFPTRVWYSEQSFQEEKIDNYRAFLPNNYRDIEGEHGEITGLYRLGNALFIHTKEGLWQLPQNNQERVTNEIVSFIGTGSFFDVPPRKTIDDSLGSGGTQHKWATVKTKNGVMFVNEIENKIYLHGGKVEDVSIKGLRNWFENNLKSFLSQQFYSNLGISYPYDNNPANPNGIGYISNYDTRYERILITKRDFLYLGNFDLLVVDFDPSQDYPEGTVILTNGGFKLITNTFFDTPVNVDYEDWEEEIKPLQLQPMLSPAATIDDPLELTYGSVYTNVDGTIVYIAKSYEDISEFVNGSVPPEPANVRDLIPVNIDACEDETLEVIILNAPSKRCPNSFNAGGFEVRDTRIVLGNKPGVVKMLVSTINQPDSFKIYYGEVSDGILLFSSQTIPTADGTTGCLSTNTLAGNGAYHSYWPCNTNPDEVIGSSGSGSVYNCAIFLTYNPTDPTVQHITLHFEGCEPGTVWGYKMGCVCNNGLPIDPEDMTTWDYCQDCST